MSESTALQQWTAALAEVPWGVQHAFHDVLTLAEKGDVTLVYNADYYNSGACLVNQAANLLITGGGHGVPMATFGTVVSLFDQINRDLYTRGINTDNNRVSPMAAEILLHYFPPFKEPPATQDKHFVREDGINTTYVEPTDDEFAESLKAMFTTPPPVEVNLTDFDPSEHESNDNAESATVTRRPESQ